MPEAQGFAAGFEALGSKRDPHVSQDKKDTTLNKFITFMILSELLFFQILNLSNYIPLFFEYKSFGVILFI